MIWRLGIWIHRKLYDVGILSRQVLPLPVISIGNISVGGSGKTSMCNFLANNEIFGKALVLTRGYGKDEEFMLTANLSPISVGIGANRAKIAREILEKYDNYHFDVILLDDGHQHWKIHKDLNIVMVNALHGIDGYYNRVLPFGMLRETWKDGLQRADIVVIHHADFIKDEKLLHSMESELLRRGMPNSFEIFQSSSIAQGIIQFGSNILKNKLPNEIQKICIASGVGCPESFEKNVQRWLGDEDVEIHKIRFRDHHQFTKRELLNLINYHGDMVITSEKDYYRILHSNVLDKDEKNKFYWLQSKFSTTMILSSHMSKIHEFKLK